MHRVMSQNFKRVLALATMATAALVAGCGGGGTAQIDPFEPRRIISFGDEGSIILSNGNKYTINGLNTTTLLPDCTINPVWNQALATGFNMVYQQCNTSYVALPQGVMYAEVGAKVADVATKIDQHMNTDGFGPKDLVTIWVGMNDILELYRQFPQQSSDALINEATARGKLLASQVNRIANANGRVLIATLYDMGDTPFGQKEKLDQTDTDRAVFLNKLTDAFNISLRLNLLNDGRLIGLVTVDETFQQIIRFPSAFGFNNVTDAACRSNVAVQDCTTSTLQSDANATQWLWASSTLPGPAAQQRIATLALTRARNNPF